MTVGKWINKIVITLCAVWPCASDNGLLFFCDGILAQIHNLKDIYFSDFFFLVGNVTFLNMYLWCVFSFQQWFWSNLSVLLLFSYIQSMPVLSEKQKEDFTCFENLMTKEFIGQQLIHIIGCMDTTEEGGR